MQEISYFETEKGEEYQHKYEHEHEHKHEHEHEREHEHNMNMNMNMIINIIMEMNINIYDLTALPCTGESSSSVPSYITFVRTLKATVLAYALKLVTSYVLHCGFKNGQK